MKIVELYDFLYIKARSCKRLRFFFVKYIKEMIHRVNPVFKLYIIRRFGVMHSSDYV